MKKLVFAGFMMMSSMGHAGTGSTVDFLVSVGAGSVMGCGDLDANTDNLRRVACNMGVALKAAGLSDSQIEKVLEEAQKVVPAYQSICNK